MNILIVGGAGYIGSHMVKYLANINHDITVYDNLSTGFLDSVLYGKFVQGDLCDIEKLNNFFKNNSFDAVFHFASSISVGESVLKPDFYYLNNINGTINLLNVMVAHGVKKFIFSSTAAIFGNPEYLPINENHPCNPISPYGKSKLFIEQILSDYEKAFDLRSVSLRYFNVAGADPEGFIGKKNNPETHLIPLLLQVASGRKDFVEIYGNDYPTHDGTCIRDYIHVVDICEAHIAALNWIVNFNKSGSFNLGNKQGYSVKEIINACVKVTCKNIKHKFTNRRVGDPAVLVADTSLANKMLGFMPKYNDIETIIEHSWLWEKKNYM